eukprot:SAG11_NODE_2902_length_2849_cov_1.654909_1_plen_122_part_00
MLGLEVAGEVVARGSEVGELQWQIGDRVCALANGGGYAEYCAVPVGQVLRVPMGLSMEEAACIPETFFTVWHKCALCDPPRRQGWRRLTTPRGVRFGAGFARILAQPFPAKQRVRAEAPFR